MELNTASEVISFAKKLEEDGARLYEHLALRYVKDSEAFLSLAQENRRNIVQIERAYYEVITDAIEGCFSFKIDPDEYVFETQPAENATHSDTSSQALEMEERITRFYFDAAEQSRPLLADVPRVFTMVARRRGDRKQKLERLFHQQG